MLVELRSLDESLVVSFKHQGSVPPPLANSTDNMTRHGFQELDHEALELVLSADYNTYGVRLATGSSDHRIRVYDQHEGDDEQWSKIDQWRAHNGEVLVVF